MGQPARDRRGRYWTGRITVAITSTANIAGDYIGFVGNKNDDQAMKGDITALVGGVGTAAQAICTIPTKRERYQPMNLHYTARGVLGHYLGLANSECATDLHPVLPCMKFDYAKDIADDTKSQWWSHQNYGTSNRNFMEYSLYRLSNLTTSLSEKEDYDHYSANLGSKGNYISAWPSRRTLTTPRRWPSPTS